MLRRHLLALAAIIAVLASACGSSAPERARSVDVTVSVVDDRDPAGIEVTATGYDLDREGRQVVADRVATTVGEDGVAELRLLDDLRYEVWGGAPITPDSTCYWNGVGTVPAFSDDPIAIRLDSDGCSGG